MKESVMSKMMSGMLFGFGIALVVCGTSFRSATADPTEAKPGAAKPTRIALVDMAKVFKTSRMFETKRDALKREISESEDSAKSMVAVLQQLKMKYDTLEKGTEERDELEKQLKAKSAEFEKYRRDVSAKFLKKESKIYLEVYEAATAEVSNHARAHDIDLVIRFTSDPLDEEDPQKLLQGMNRQVIYDNGLDITDEIIAAMK
jgi:Skp family chaperone for outer membrane proteins